ncbi:YraN family protein [Novosphingobium lentum]|uniref:YraN family protein n=1 Tax=Novosphingobium lentum TaxID=145287 RepID=UPI00082B912E|nr:YraN family protein [Novosphingobium lentum]
MTSRRIEAERQGRRGETFAMVWLRLAGWRVLARRQRVGAGEVDLIVRRGRMVAFVEVKWRATAADRDLAIDARRLQRVARAAEVLAPRYVRDGDDMRIDVLLLAPGRWPRHITNAWQP